MTGKQTGRKSALSAFVALNCHFEDGVTRNGDDFKNIVTNGT
jgi:hypothetical protein